MTNTTLAFPTPASLGSLDHYIQAVNRFPLLTVEQETANLAARLQRVRRHRRRAASSCCRTCGSSSPCRRNYLGYGLPQADLIQEGNVGLMKAVRRFDPGARRAPRVVRAALDPGRDARVHPAQLAAGQGRDDQGAAQALLQPAQHEGELGRAVGRRRPRRIAKDLGVKPEEVVEMETRLGGHDVALDPTPGDEDELRVADRLSDRSRRRAGADPRAGSRPRSNRTTGLQAGACRSSTTAAAASSRRAGCARTTRARRCRTWPTSTACRPSGSARSRARRMKSMRSADGGDRLNVPQPQPKNAGFVPAFSLAERGRYSSTCVPSSTTRLVGI